MLIEEFRKSVTERFGREFMEYSLNEQYLMELSHNYPKLDFVARQALKVVSKNSSIVYQDVIKRFRSQDNPDEYITDLFWNEIHSKGYDYNRVWYCQYSRKFYMYKSPDFSFLMSVEERRQMEQFGLSYNQLIDFKRLGMSAVVD
jgi:hypothetical protein